MRICCSYLVAGLASTESSLLGLLMMAATISSLLVACGAQGGVTASELAETEWVLVELNGSPVLPEAPISLAFREGASIAGTGGCNNYFGSIQWVKNQFTIGPIGATRMACPEQIMDQENSYFKALEHAQSATFDGPVLLIHSAGFESPLRFERKSPETDE